MPVELKVAGSNPGVVLYIFFPFFSFLGKKTVLALCIGTSNNNKQLA